MAEKYKLPTSVDEFCRIWRNLDTLERLAMLEKLSSNGLSSIFHAELPPDILGEIVATLLAFKSSTSHDVASVVLTLDTLSNCKRFKLGLQFLSSAERNTLVQLFEKLSRAVRDHPQDLAELTPSVTEWSLQQLQAKYVM